MLKFKNNHSDEFTHFWEPTFIPLMQITASLFTEAINIALICLQPTIMDCIMNFIALGAISEIDNYYAGSL